MKFTSSMPDGKLARWSTASCALALHVNLLSPKKRKKENFVKHIHWSAVVGVIHVFDY
jgi:hypothetical protein